MPAFARILLRTSLGKKHLVRPLLRTEITQVVNRRAWYDATKLTMDVLSLYKVCPGKLCGKLVKFTENLKGTLMSKLRQFPERMNGNFKV